ncbi:hypothetical protein D3C76_963800 [compost metagenome]
MRRASAWSRRAESRPPSKIGASNAADSSCSGLFSRSPTRSLAKPLPAARVTRGNSAARAAARSASAAASCASARAISGRRPSSCAGIPLSIRGPARSSGKVPDRRSDCGATPSSTPSATSLSFSCWRRLATATRCPATSARCWASSSGMAAPALSRDCRVARTRSALARSSSAMRSRSPSPARSSHALATAAVRPRRNVSRSKREARHCWPAASRRERLRPQKSTS